MQKIAMQNRRSKWLVVLAVSILVTVLRLIDFADEAVNEGFHMTRAGFDLIGTNALALQLIILFISLLFVWVATSKLYATSRVVLPAPTVPTSLISLQTVTAIR
jgi:uncharacterized BrkB/YihY/UPF0761 family membrane protein